MINHTLHPLRHTRKSRKNVGRMSFESDLLCACWRFWQIKRKQETRGSESIEVSFCFRAIKVVVIRVLFDWYGFDIKMATICNLKLTPLLLFPPQKLLSFYILNLYYYCCFWHNSIMICLFMLMCTSLRFPEKAPRSLCRCAWMDFYGILLYAW